MAATAHAFAAVPSAANSPLVSFAKEGNQKALGTISIKVENFGSSTFTGKIQESADGVSYSDVSGAVFTALVSKGEATINVLTVNRFLRLVGSGNTVIRVDAMYEGRVLRGSLDVLVISSTGSPSGITDNLTRVYDGLN